MIALATVASAKPWGYYTGVPYTQAHIQGLAYTHALGLAHAPVAYTAPVAAQTCKNEAGALVPCAIPAGFIGNSVYAYNHSPVLPAVVAAAAPVAEEPAAVEAPAAVEEAIIDVKKREAEAGPEAGAHYYYGYPWYGYRAYGCRNVYGALVPCAGR